MPRVFHQSGRLSLLLVTGLMLIAVLPTASVTALQAEPAPAAEIGAPPILEPAWSFTGRGQTAQGQFTAVGTLTAISGLEAARLTAGADAASRFTVVADIPISDTSSRGTAITVLGSGTVTIYLRDPAVDPPLDPIDPETYRSGVVVAEYNASFQSTAQRETPEVGIISGSMTLDQTQALIFPLDEERLRFGHAEAQLKLTFLGGLLPNITGAPTTEASIFGTAKVSRRAAEPTDTGEAEIAPVLSECEQLVAWIDDTRTRLRAAAELRNNLPDPTSADTSAEDISAAADTASRLLNEQLALETPEGADAANRLALSSLSTDVRGLQLLAAAVESGDETAITQAQAVQSDAAGLATRALQTLEEITPTCEPEA